MKICVVGAGSMGRNHARVISDVPGAELVAVVDADREAAARTATRYGATPYASVQEMLLQVQPVGAIVAVPTHLHEEVAAPLMRKGVHVLVEKPIAQDIASADRLMALAADAGVILVVGHIERFNAAVLELKARLDKGELGRIFHVETHRRGPFPSRINDVGVVLDLAVHDLDLVRFITGDEVAELSATTARRLHATHEDFLRCTLRLAHGAIGTLTIDWLTPTKIREVLVTGERGMFRVDLLTQDLYFFENSAAPAMDWGSMEILRGINEGSMTRFLVPKREPLRAQLEAFVARLAGQAAPTVTGSDGRYALSLALAVLDASRERRVIPAAPAA